MPEEIRHSSGGLTYRLTPEEKKMQLLEFHLIKIGEDLQKVLQNQIYILERLKVLERSDHINHGRFTSY